MIMLFLLVGAAARATTAFVPPAAKKHTKAAALAKKVSQSPDAAATRRTDLGPQTPRQRAYWEALTSPASRLVVASGAAGSGKTFLACRYAVASFVARDYDKVVLTRPIVSVQNENIGFLPGTQSAKMDPWMCPLFDNFAAQGIPKGDIQQLLKKTTIEIVPLGVMRGRTFHRTLILADEMQNSTPSQMRMLLTRIGQGSKVVVTGDTSQCDIATTNGLQDLRDRLRLTPTTTVAMIELGRSDVKRDPFVKEVLGIYGHADPYYELDLDD